MLLWFLNRYPWQDWYKHPRIFWSSTDSQGHQNCVNKTSNASSQKVSYYLWSSVPISWPRLENARWHWCREWPQSMRETECRFPIFWSLCMWRLGSLAIAGLWGCGCSERLGMLGGDGPAGAKLGGFWLCTAFVTSLCAGFGAGFTASVGLT